MKLFWLRKGKVGCKGQPTKDAFANAADNAARHNDILHNGGYVSRWEGLLMRPAQ